MSESTRPTSTPTGTPATGRRRGGQTAGDMVRSLAIVLAVVGVVFFLTLRDEPSSKDQVRAVGYAEQLARTREVATYDVYAPVGLGAGWTATSARGDTDGAAVTWHLGFVTPTHHYAGLEQSNGAAARLVADHADRARAVGRVTVNGHAWQRLAGGEPDQRALVLRGPDSTTMVTGTAGWGELTILARSLRGG